MPMNDMEWSIPGSETQTLRVTKAPETRYWSGFRYVGVFEEFFKKIQFDDL